MAVFETDMFYLMLANCLIAFPNARKHIDELYQSQRFRFYEKAKNNKYYDNMLMKDKPLELEVSMKRAYGILLCSQDDEQLQSDIIAEIYKVYPVIETICKHYDVDFAKKKQQDFWRSCDTSNLGPDAKNGFIYFVAYVFSCKYGFDSEESGVSAFYKNIAADIETRQEYFTSNLIADIDNIRAKELISISRNQRKLIETIQRGQDFIELVDAYDILNGENVQTYLSSTADYKLSLLKNIKQENEGDVSAIWFYLNLLGSEFDMYGLSVVEFFSILNISKTERDRALKYHAYLFGARSGKEYQPLNLSYYFLSLLFGQLAKLLKYSRDFYFENNSETQYNELQKMSAANAALKEQVAELTDIRKQQQNHIEVLKSQIKSLSAELSKDTKDAMRPLYDEISLLQSQIAALQNDLDAEREKTVELNRLREFVFSLESGQDIPDAKTPLGDLVAGKKIFIFGGHVNWRNKMKAVYPALNILDGHNESFDERLLLSADMVLLNTSNMSHALYYKVIDVLRKNEIPFDYIGRYNNIELMEQEIAAILQK